MIFLFVKQQEDLGGLNGYIEEMIEGSKVIKVFTHEEISKKDFDRLNEELFKSGSSANSYGKLFNSSSFNSNIFREILVRLLLDKMTFLKDWIISSTSKTSNKLFFNII